jgi:hypothetical protein
MVGKIGTNTSTHQLAVSEFSNEQLKNTANRELRALDRSRGGSSTILDKGTLGRFVAHALHLGQRTEFVREQNTKVVAAFARALDHKGIDGTLRDHAVQSLRERVANLNSQKTILTFADLDSVLEQMDAKALDIVTSYLPASSDKAKGMLKIKEDGAQFTAIAEKHKLETPEIKEKFRNALEARILGLANDPQVGPSAVLHSLHELAEESAVGLTPGHYDKPVVDLFNEFPVGLTDPKIIQDGSYQIQGNPKEGAQTFIYFKRNSADNIPYDAQGAVDRRQAALGNSAKADTPAAKGLWANAEQKYHFSVDKQALHNGQAWPLLHDLLTSEENPFLQWKIGNPNGLGASVKTELDHLKKDFFETGPQLVSDASGKKKTYPPIPQMEQDLEKAKNLQGLRKDMVTKGSMSQDDYNKYGRALAAQEAEVNYVLGEFKKKHEDLSSDGRCVDGAQFTLYTQNDPDKPWQADDVKKYTQFLSKLEDILTNAGIEPGQLPESDVVVPGLRFATVRDEGIGDAAERSHAGLDYQNPPEWLKQQYRDTDFFKLSAQTVSLENPAIKT